MKIDATRAIKALGIKGNVEFRWEDLSDSASAMARNAGVEQGAVCPAATNPSEPLVVKLDLAALMTCAEHGEPFAVSIAHELVHIRQFQEFDSAEAVHNAYVASIERYGYYDSPFERQAETLAPQLARLITVMP